jgi:ABC-2 type transport system permease protein
MMAIYEREFKAYFKSPVAYIVMGFFILLTSVFYYLGNIYTRSADLSSLFSSMGIFLLFIAPLLTMKSISEDRKSGTEVLLVTSSIKLHSIVLGKYLASLSVFLTMTLITLIYPIILAFYSQLSFYHIVGEYLGFIFLGASMLAVGVFASSLTENQITAAVISFVSLLIIMALQPFGVMVGGILSKILGWFSLFSRFDDFERGILDLRPIIYYLSFVFVFLFLTVRVLEKRSWSRG